MKKTALITGITGQDGAYLAHSLLADGFEVHGIRRRSSSFNTGRIDDIYVDPHSLHANLFLHYGDLTDPTSILKVINEVNPDYIYNLAAQSHVAVSFVQPAYTIESNMVGVVQILEAVRNSPQLSKTRVYQASTSEIFGSSNPPQNEKTLMLPQSPYAVSKLGAYWLIRNYRDAYQVFASNGILFNHESPIRGETFVTRKITRGLANIIKGKQNEILLGNLDSQRDWGHARDYVEAQRLIIESEKADDFVIATGKQRSIREFIETCCAYLNLEVEWHGSGLDEIVVDKKSSRVLIRVSQDYFRPLEVDSLLGDSDKAKRILGWTPKTSFEDLVKEMIDYDLALANGERPKIKWVN